MSELEVIRYACYRDAEAAAEDKRRHAPVLILSLATGMLVSHLGRLDTTVWWRVLGSGTNIIVQGRGIVTPLTN